MKPLTIFFMTPLNIYHMIKMFFLYNNFKKSVSILVSMYLFFLNTIFNLNNIQTKMNLTKSNYSIDFYQDSIKYIYWRKTKIDKHE